ncbi:MAG TPA: hypothetical protein VGM47_02205 [Gammaproteobacteria bacterium]|jgi:hypothetical protein
MQTFAKAFLGASLLVPGLGTAATVAPLPADGKLVYVQQANQSCTLDLWDSATAKSRTLAPSIECPKAVAVTSHEHMLVLFDQADIRLFDLDAGKLGAPIPLPSDVPPGYLDLSSWLAGYTQDGTLALELGVPSAHADTERRLYLRKDDSWEEAEHISCGYYQDSCPFKQKVAGRILDGTFGKVPGQIWNPAVAGDPYVVQRSPADIAFTPNTDDEPPADPSDDAEPAAPQQVDPLPNTIVFRIDGRYAKVRFGAQAGEDTDGTYPTGLELVTPDQIAHKLTDGQFDAVIVGHYLLFYELSDHGAQLYDVGNGHLLLNQLLVAGWLYR